MLLALLLKEQEMPGACIMVRGSEAGALMVCNPWDGLGHSSGILSCDDTLACNCV